MIILNHRNTRAFVIVRVGALLALLNLCGCMTRGVCGRAKMNTQGIPSERVEQPGYYFLAPLTLAGDIVTSPIQAYLHFTCKGTEIDPWR